MAEAPQNTAPRRLRIGWLADLETLANRPARLAELQDRLGMDIVWLESGRVHTAGYRLSKEAWRSSPFQDWRTRSNLKRHRLVHHLPETSYPVLPGILADAEDSDLWTVIHAAQPLDLEVWGHLGLWSYGGMVYPELAVRDIAGRPISEEEDRWGSCFCPSKPALNNWLAACLQDSIRRYPLRGIEVDHARYPPPHSLPNLLTCACPDCARQAAGWGTDLAALAAELRSALDRLAAMPAPALARVLANSASLWDVANALLPARVAGRWLETRARQLSFALRTLSATAHQAAGGPFQFGIDVFPPSIALLGGHDYAGLDSLDYFTGGFGTIGWERAGLQVCREWARALLRHWPELEEEQTLRALYRLFGFEGLNLPNRIDTPALPPQIDLARLEAAEIRRIAADRPAKMKIFPPVSLPALGLEGCELVCRAAAESGMEGVFIAGLESLSPESEKQLTAVLKSIHQEAA